MLLLESSVPTRPSTDLSGAPRLSVALTFDGSRCELWLSGRLDTYSLVALRAQIDQCCAEPFEEVVVHLDELDGPDELVRSALSAMQARVEEGGARFRLDGMREPVPVCLRRIALDNRHDR
jgi:anti-anti-sigma regulatory factor